jgi:hypothetical protein
MRGGSAYGGIHGGGGMNGYSRGGGRGGGPDAAAGECFKCHKFGHWAKNCPSEQSSIDRQNGSGRGGAGSYGSGESGRVGRGGSVGRGKR